MARPRLGVVPLTAAERMARSRQRQAERMAKLEEVLQHMADGIAHVRELGAHWSDDQRQAWLNGLELAARKALPE